MDIQLQSVAVLFFKYFFPPLFYAFHGWIATKMAIWALFHPYQPWYFPGTRLSIPGTPGIFPKRRAKLAQAVAATVTDTLLTSEDIRNQAEHLVTEHNIYVAVDAFVNSVLTEFRDTTKLHRLAVDVAELTPFVVEHLAASIFTNLEDVGETRIVTMVEKIFDSVVVGARVSPAQANELASRLMDTILTADQLRKVLINLLTASNINALDESIQTYASTPYKILARIIGVKRVCNEWRSFFEQEPSQANSLISDLLKRFAIHDKLSAAIADFDLRSLPVQTVAELRSSLTVVVKSFLVDQQTEIMVALRKLESEAASIVRTAIIQFNPDSIPNTWLHRAKQDISAFLYQYLKRELGVLLEQAIPALGMHSLIARKIDLFTPYQLEQLIYRLCEQELAWLAWLGGLIGAWLGLIQIAVNVAFP